MRKLEDWVMGISVFFLLSFRIVIWVTSHAHYTPTRINHVQYSTVQYSTSRLVQHSTSIVQYQYSTSTVQYQYSTAQHSTVQYSTSTVQHSTVQYRFSTSTVRHSTVQYSTVQYQYSTVQYRFSTSTVQHSAVHLKSRYILTNQQLWRNLIVLSLNHLLWRRPVFSESFFTVLTSDYEGAQYGMV